MEPSVPPPSENCTYIGNLFDLPKFGPDYTVPCTVTIKCEKPNLGGIVSTRRCRGTQTCNEVTTVLYDAFLCYPKSPCLGTPEVVKVFVSSETKVQCKPCKADGCDCPPGYVEVGRSES